jgi:alcohol dehydrogenase (cytochrome c)/quinohemoprotein ethanol dehydrogenase
MKGHLAAWNPVTQKEAWRVDYPLPWNGGTLATAGNLVFHGTGMGTFSAYQADAGKQLWTVETHTGILAPPMTYEIDGEQYVAVEIGWGGAFGLAAGELARDTHVKGNAPRVLAFKLDGKETMPPGEEVPARPLQTPPGLPKPQAVAQGKILYSRSCGTCHGDSAVSGGVLPDLRYSPALADAKLWQSIVHDGALKERGMAAFAIDLTADDIELIRGYVIHRAYQQAALEGKAPPN